MRIADIGLRVEERHKKKIKTFSDGTILQQGPGRFDDFCVYITRPDGKRYAPKDKQYFSFFIEKSAVYGNEKIYYDYVSIYDKTQDFVNDEVLEEIAKISGEYKADILNFEIWFSVIYLGMVAEERKSNTILKKRIKRLGMYQIMLENMSAEEAATFSWGKKVRELDPLCKERGF